MSSFQHFFPASRYGYVLGATHLVITLSSTSPATQTSHVGFIQKLNANNHIGVLLRAILLRDDSDNVQGGSNGASPCPARIRSQLA